MKEACAVALPLPIVINVIYGLRSRQLGKIKNLLRCKLDMLTGPSRAGFDCGPCASGGGRVQKAVVHFEIQIFKKPSR